MNDLEQLQGELDAASAQLAAAKERQAPALIREAKRRHAVALGALITARRKPLKIRSTSHDNYNRPPCESDPQAR